MALAAGPGRDYYRCSYVVFLTALRVQMRRRRRRRLVVVRRAVALYCDIRCLHCAPGQRRLGVIVIAVQTRLACRRFSLLTLIPIPRIRPERYAKWHVDGEDDHVEYRDYSHRQPHAGGGVLNESGDRADRLPRYPRDTCEIAPRSRRDMLAWPTEKSVRAAPVSAPVPFTVRVSPIIFGRAMFGLQRNDAYADVSRME